MNRPPCRRCAWNTSIMASILTDRILYRGMPDSLRVREHRGVRSSDCAHIRVAQPVEWRSPKPQDDGSTPSPYTNRRGQPGVLCGQMRFTVNHTVGHNGMQGIPCLLPGELEARLHLGLAAGVRGIHLVTVIPSEAWWRTGRQCACLLRHRRRMPNGSVGMQTGVRHRVTCGGLGEWCNGQHDGLWNRMLQVRILPRLRKVGPWCRLAPIPIERMERSGIRRLRQHRRRR